MNLMKDRACRRICHVGEKAMSKVSVLSAAILTCLMAQSVYAQQVVPAEQDAEVKTLDAIKVEGAFLNSSAKSAAKMDIDVMDTPFSVQSYSESFIDSIEATTLSDVFNYMTGVKRAGLTGMDISFRGFKSSGDDLNSLLVDGLPGMAGRFGSPPTVALQQVELVRGSMSVLYGQNQPGGFINLITKKPEYHRHTAFGIRGTAVAGAGLSLGDATGYGIDFDTTGYVDEGGNLLYRFVGDHGDKDTFRDYGFDKTTYFAPSITWNIGGQGSSTHLTAQFEYRKSKSAFDQGLVAPDRDINLVAPVTTFYGEPGQFRDEKGNVVSLFLSHAFESGLQWNTSVRSVDYSSSQQEFSHVGIRPNGRTLNRRARHLETERSYDNYDSNLTFEFQTGQSIDHKVVFGVSGGRNKLRETRLKFFNSVCPGQYCFDIDIYNPVYGRTPAYDSIPAYNPGSSHLLTNNGSTSTNTAFYVSDLISVGERWKLLFGLRNFSEKQRLYNLNDPNKQPVEKTSKKSALPMVGVLFQPSAMWTLYASYSESYVPADPDDMDIHGENPFKPLTGEQFEAGVKVEKLLDGRLNASLALFKIDQLNVMNSFTCSYGVCYDQLGNARSEGVEVEANLRVSDQWQLKAGYAYTDARVIDSNVAVQVGARLANAPKHTANLWSEYYFNNGLSISAGASHIGNYQGIVPSASAPKLMPIPGYTLLDFVLGYRINEHVFNLKLGNVLDKDHYEATGLTGQIQIVPGMPRNLAFSYRYSF